MRFTYPSARRTDVVDDYHGTQVPDPYRWLEDPDSPETAAFIAGQNAISLPYLAALPERSDLHERMTRMWDVPRTGTPVGRGGVVVWSHNDGLQNQPVYYIRRGEAEPAVLLDPNDLSADGTVAVVTTSLSPDGTRFAYSLAEAGSDWQVIRIRNASTGDDLEDELQYVKFTTVAWFGDGLFYSRFPAQTAGSTAPSRQMSVYFHRLGTSQEDDELVFANADDPDPGYVPIVTEDDAYLVLIEWEGTSHENGLLYRPAGSADEFTRLVSPGIARHDFIEHHDGAFLVLTDWDAPNGRIVRLPLDRPDERTEVVAETGEPLEWVAAAAGRLFAGRLRDASHRIEIYHLDGAPAGEVGLPAAGTVTGLTGRLDDPEIYFGYESFLRPPAAFQWNGQAVTRFAGSEPPLDPADFVVERRSALSSDGARVGMFVLRAAATALPAPTEVYGYGGFTISLTPQFDPARLAFVAAGGVAVVANLRGGSEHGEEWHRAGMLGNKQQVFEDFIACAAGLVADGVAAPGGVGIRGRSNGGLLSAAAFTQRPDLFGAVVSTVPVADMLRYQHFTAGRYWTVEYGDAADPEAFRWLIAYSPLHNVRDDVAYPPVLITTGESDDRVVPMHSFKLAAALQHAAGGASDEPLLLRVDVRAGHGLGKPTDKLIDEAADVYGFLLHHLRAGSAARSV
jgi:prolyl oligopeptidase